MKKLYHHIIIDGVKCSCIAFNFLLQENHHSFSLVFAELIHFSIITGNYYNVIFFVTVGYKLVVVCYQNLNRNCCFLQTNCLKVMNIWYILFWFGCYIILLHYCRHYILNLIHFIYYCWYLFKRKVLYTFLIRFCNCKKNWNEFNRNM